MKLFSFMALCLILFLSACSGTGGEAAVKARYEAPATPGGRLCLSQCRNAQSHCTDACGLEERTCVNEAQTQAIKDYEAYVRDQFMARAEVELRPRDFERTQSCGAKSCRKSCAHSFDDCFVKCGGKIEKETTCRYFCFD